MTQIDFDVYSNQHRFIRDVLGYRWLVKWGASSSVGSPSVLVLSLTVRLMPCFLMAPVPVHVAVHVARCLVCLDKAPFIHVPSLLHPR